MDDDDTDQFESADEGLDSQKETNPENLHSDSNDENSVSKNLTRNTSDRPLSLPVQFSPQSSSCLSSKLCEKEELEVESKLDETGSGSAISLGTVKEEPTPITHATEVSRDTPDLTEDRVTDEVRAVDPERKQEERTPSAARSPPDHVPAKSRRKGHRKKQQKTSVSEPVVQESPSKEEFAEPDHVRSESPEKESAAVRQIEELDSVVSEERFDSHDAESLSTTVPSDALGDDRSEMTSSEREPPSVPMEDVVGTEEKRTEEEEMGNPEVLTATATNLIRGVGDGLSSLADALVHVVQPNAEAEDEPTPITHATEVSRDTPHLTEDRVTDEVRAVDPEPKPEEPTPSTARSPPDRVPAKSRRKGHRKKQQKTSVSEPVVRESPSKEEFAEPDHVRSESPEKESAPVRQIEELDSVAGEERFDSHDAESLSTTVPSGALGDDGSEMTSSEREPPSVPMERVVGTEENRTEEEEVWNPEVLTATATNLIRGVGDGLSSLADALVHVVQPNAEAKQADDEDPEVFERRRRRMLEEKAEREALYEAWSNVWDAAWNINDGWDIDEVHLSESDTARSGEGSQYVAEKAEENPSSEPSVSKTATQESEKSEAGAFWDWSGVSSLAQQLTSSFQTKGLTLVQEGVNVLEKIGKKTMSVIEENDPGFQYTKALLKPPGLQERPNLSQIIREAHERHQNERTTETTKTEFNRGNFTAQLESKRALVHLEALELVSDKAESQLHIQLDNLPPTSHLDAEPLTLDGGVLEAIWRTMQLDDDEDTSAEGTDFPDSSTWKILKCKKQHQQPGSYGPYPNGLSEKNSLVWVAFERSLSMVKAIYPGEKLLQSITNVWNDTLKAEDTTTTEDLFFNAIGALAEVTSAQLEYLHKFAECTLVRTHKPTADFERLTSIVATNFRAAVKLIDALSSEYTRAIKSVSKTHTDIKPTKSASQLVGGLLLECGNAQRYLQNAARLLIPVLQLACVNTKRAASEADC